MNINVHTYYFIHHETLFIHLFCFLVPGIGATSGSPPLGASRPSRLRSPTALPLPIPTPRALPYHARSSCPAMSTHILLISHPFFIRFVAKNM